MDPNSLLGVVAAALGVATLVIPRIFKTPADQRASDRLDAEKEASKFVAKSREHLKLVREQISKDSIQLEKDENESTETPK